MKICPRCGIEKPLDQFGFDISKSSGHKSWCKDCENTKSRAYYEANRDRKRTYYQANRERIQARNAARDPAEHARYQREWKAANPEKARLIKERQRKREARHRGMVLEQLWEDQDGLCYLCEEPLPPIGSRGLHLDHDHNCCPACRSCPACRRGLAHGGCNTAIGLAGEDPAKLRRMADNLERALSS